MNKNVLLVISSIAIILIGGIYFLNSNKDMNSMSSGSESSVEENVDFTGDKGQEVFANLNGQVEIPLDIIISQKVQFYNHKLPSGKIVYFMIYKDQAGVIRAAATSNDICAGTGKGYSVEGENIICNNCGKSYPAANIGVEGGDCNPFPISSNVEVVNGNALIDTQSLEGIARFF